MIYPEADTDEWAERWGLVISEWECPLCKGKFKTTVPIYLQDMVGLQTPKHGCGENMCKVILTPRTDSAKEFWGKVLS